VAKIKAFIFDMDGTLLDTERLSTISWQEGAKKMGFKLDDDFMLSIKGTNQSHAKALFDEHYHGHPKFDDAKVYRNEYFFNYIRNHDIPVLKGGRELLSYLKENKYLVCLATSSGRAYSEYITKKTGIYPFFDYVVCGDQVKESKPNPAIFLKCAELAHVSNKEAVVVEDSLNGVKAGRNGNFKVVGIPNVAIFNDEARKCCNYVFDSLLDLLNYLKKK
jgi:HAD superfamily hydrolase (TIGR01509 family)